MRQLIILTSVILIGALNLFGWGNRGHAIIAAVAESRLKQSTLVNVRSLLGNQSMASVASWADDVRDARDYTYNWHFVDIPWNADAFDDSRDCYLPKDKHAAATTDHKNCVVDRIPSFEMVLAGKQDRQEALKFLIHFIGDAHQPFHSIGDARGGNLIHIALFGKTNCGSAKSPKPCNLHSAWDDNLIQHTGRSQQQYIAYIQSLITQDNIASQSMATPVEWANDAHRLGKAAWVNQGGSIDEDYFKAQIKVVDRQLALGAVRLANAIEQYVTAGDINAGKAKKKISK